MRCSWTWSWTSERLPCESSCPDHALGGGWPLSRKGNLKPVLKTGGPVRAPLLRGRHRCVLQASQVLELRRVPSLLLWPRHLPSGTPLLHQPLLHPTSPQALVLLPGNSHAEPSATSTTSNSSEEAPCSSTPTSGATTTITSWRHRCGRFVGRGRASWSSARFARTARREVGTDVSEADQGCHLEGSAGRSTWSAFRAFRATQSVRFQEHNT